SDILVGKTKINEDGTTTTGTMPNLTSNATITYTSSNSTKVIVGDAAFACANSDSVNRVAIRYNGSAGYITANTLFAIAYATMASAIGLTAAKLASGNTVLGISGSYTGVGTAAAAQVLTGYTFSNASSSGASGTMANRAGTTTAATTSLDSTNSRVKMTIPSAGYYDTAAALYATYSTMASVIGLTAAKLGYGKTCLGLTGTYKPTVKQISAIAYRGLNDGNTDDDSEEASYTCPAAGTCYYNGSAYSENSRNTVTCEIYKNGTLVDSRNIDSSNSYCARGTMVGQSFSVASGDVIKIVAAVKYSSTTYAKVAQIDATIVTYS
ncbi:MAG: hypothetical protein LIO92_13090, partial [Clostridiales bacterium]|nr:hypothetical protein [Clostridiales bacterium]